MGLDYEKLWVSFSDTMQRMMVHKRQPSKQVMHYVNEFLCGGEDDAGFYPDVRKHLREYLGREPDDEWDDWIFWCMWIWDQINEAFSEANLADDPEYPNGNQPKLTPLMRTYLKDVIFAKAMERTWGDFDRAWYHKMRTAFGKYARDRWG